MNYEGKRIFKKKRLIQKLMHIRNSAAEEGHFSYEEVVEVNMI